MVEINKSKLFDCSANSTALSINELATLHGYYETCCTAEFLMENYDISDEEEAIFLGYRVRERMDKYSLTEDVAIDEIMSERGQERD